MIISEAKRRVGRNIFVNRVHGIDLYPNTTVKFFNKKVLTYQKQVDIPIVYDGITFGEGWSLKGMKRIIL